MVVSGLVRAPARCPILMSEYGLVVVPFRTPMSVKVWWTWSWQYIWKTGNAIKRQKAVEFFFSLFFPQKKSEAYNVFHRYGSYIESSKCPSGARQQHGPQIFPTRPRIGLVLFGSPLELIVSASSTLKAVITYHSSVRMPR